LVDLLASWNIKPASVTGHSSGEIAAAYATGALTQESALAVAYYRGVAATAIKDVKALKPGAMLAVGLSREETQPLITDLSQGVVSIACINSPTSVTVSGDDPAIEELLIILQKKGVFARKLAVDTAYHSHHMMHVVDGYLDSLRNLQTNNLPDVEFYSSVTGRRRELSELGPAYWAANMVSPVQFSDSVQNLCLGTDSKRRKRRSANAAVDVLVEIGPHSALSGPIKQNLKSNARLCSSSIEYASVLVRKTNAIDTSLGLASYLFRRGVPIDLHAINCPSGHESNRLLVDLPPYTWNHSTLYWARSLKSSGTGNVGFPRSDFLGVSVKNSNSLEPCWRNIMRTSEIPWIQDHNVQSNTVCPAACFLVMAVEAAYQRATTRGVNIIGYKLREVSIGHALVIPQTSDEVETMLSLRPYSESVRKSSDIWDEFCISSSTNGVTWIEHCRGLISVQKQTEVTEVDGGREDNEEKEEYIRMIASFEAECATKHEMNEIYMALRDLGLNFGPTFANMEKACSSSEKCIAEITIPNTAAVMPAKFEYPFILHPATLDGFIHAVFPVEISNENLDQGTPVPTFIEEMFVSHGISKEPTHKFKVYAKSERIDLGNSSSKGLEQTRNSLTVFDAEQVDYKPVVNISGLRFSSLHRESSSEFRENAQRLSYQTNWKPDPDFLSGNQLVWLSDSFRLSLKIKDQARMIQQAAFYYTERALKMVPATELPNMDPHHRKLYIVLSHFCDSVYEGQLGLFDTSSWLNVNEAGRDALCASVIPTSYEILCHIGKNLPQIFRKEVDPLALMMEGDRLEKHYRTNQLLSQSYEQAAAYIDLLANKNPYLNILEIGAGTGGATFPVLQVLGGSDGKSPRFSNYDFTDISTGFFEKVMEKTQAFGGLITFRKLDIETDPLKQGFQPGSYDLIIAANVLHATSRMENTMARVRSLLKPGGTLILIEITVKNLAASVIFGTLPGWWIGMYCFLSENLLGALSNLLCLTYHR
jgi:malonyl CoA-acyl carrier protein transacylase/SAM-dependent methyltransferase